MFFCYIRNCIDDIISMKKSLITLYLLLVCTISSAQTTDYATLVNPLIGTDGKGNVYPGAQAPFGMVQLSPDNGLPGWDRIAGYFYPDSTIAGFSHTHLSGTGAGDLYDISFMPVTHPIKVADGSLGIHSTFSHDREECHAGYYRVHLDSYNIDVELTATERCGIQRYTYPSDTATVLLNLAKAMNWDSTNDTHITVVDSFTIEGFRYSNGWARGQQVYFRTRFSHPITSFKCDSAIVTYNGENRMRPGIIEMKFSLGNKKRLTIVTALSGTGMDGAAKNMAVEAPHNDFDLYCEKAQEIWNNRLSCIEIKGGTHDEQVCFYTALYRTMLAPTLYCDVDSTYRGVDGKNHKADSWQNYSTFSLWDTFRAAHPLYTLTLPERTGEMINSFIAFYEQHGRLPVWNMWGSETDMMIGYHAVPVIADAYLKGVGDFNAEKALAACIATANCDEYRGIGIYKELGYIPYDVTDTYNADNWAMSRTLEYAFDDYCIARMAEVMGHDSIATVFYHRAGNWRNQYNPNSTFMQPRNSNGEFQPKFNPNKYTQHICESNAWHYMWSVQHNINGLIELMGKKIFEHKLDSMFTCSPDENDELPIFSTGMIGQYAHGNEPSHHVAYLFNYIGMPEKTRLYVQQIMKEMYRNSPDGLCGNEDCGQMSAWFVMSAMGFYPVNPCGGEYELGMPLFPETILHLANGKTFTVVNHFPEQTYSNTFLCSKNRPKAEEDSPVTTLNRSDSMEKNIPEWYKDLCTYLNGKRLKGTTISHMDIMQGGMLEFKQTE